MDGTVVVVFFLLAGAMLALAIYGAASKSKLEDGNRSYLKSELSKIPGFSAGQFIYSSDYSKVLAVDSESERICLIGARLVWTNSHGNNRIASGGRVGSLVRVVDCHDILSVEIEEDSEGIPLSMRPGDMGRAIVGGMIAGPAGAIAGVTTSGALRKATKSAKRIDLRITISDIDSPVLVINLLNKPKADASHERNLAQQWEARIKVLIHLAGSSAGSLKQERDGKSLNVGTYNGTNSPSIAAELRALADLVKDGTLTAAEFDVQKARLLNS